jgi:hypothetical protein
MRRSDFVNPSDRGFEAQVAQFLANLGPVKTALGLPANWEAQLQTRKNNFTTALNSLDLAEANYRQAKQTKDAARRSLESEFRNLVRQLRANPSFTNAMAASLGLPPRDREPTPIPARSRNPDAGGGGAVAAPHGTLLAGGRARGSSGQACVGAGDPAGLCGGGAERAAPAD